MAALKYCVEFGCKYYYYYYYSFNGLFFRTARVSRHQKSRTILVKPVGFIGARDSKWQWHQLGDMLICTLL